MQSEVVTLEVTQANSISEKEVLDYLIATGINSCYRSYDAESKKMASEFFSLPLKYAADCWDHLESNVKVQILDKNADTFRRWLKENS